WSGRVDVFKPLRSQLCEIYDALFQITEDVNRDAETKVKARDLEAIAINLSDCVRMLSETIQKERCYRKSGYDQMKIAVNEIAENLECNTEFPAETEVKSQKKKRQLDYEEAVDEPLTEKNKFNKKLF
ncbi:hypothetical protein ILUMI_16664, partial [Ignelater luminosus]